MEKYTVEIEIPVAWGEMDAFQHVNNVHYFRYFESCRFAYGEKFGFREEIQKSGIGQVVKSLECRYKFPLTYPDTILVGAKLIKMTEDCYFMKQRIWSTRHEKIAALGEIVLVSYDFNKKKRVPIPEGIRKRVLEIEKGE